MSDFSDAYIARERDSHAVRVEAVDNYLAGPQLAISCPKQRLDVEGLGHGVATLGPTEAKDLVDAIEDWLEDVGGSPG